MPFLLYHIRKLEFHEPDILWFTDPRHISILKYIKPRYIFYRCVDDLEQFDDVPQSLIRKERKLVEMSNGVFLTSKELLNKFKGLNKNIYYLPNGCDFSFFNNPPKNETIELEIKKFFDSTRINILYMGAIAEWFDFEAIEYLAEDRNIHVVIVGPIRVAIPKQLLLFDNVIFTGPYEYSYMPYFAKYADVGIIPFVVSSLTDAVNPIKLYEYCAAGLPVITSGVKTITEIEGPFRIYTSKSELKEALKWTISIKDKEGIIQFAQSNSWEKRARFIEKVLKEF